MSMTSNIDILKSAMVWNLDKQKLLPWFRIFIQQKLMMPPMSTIEIMGCCDPSLITWHFTILLLYIYRLKLQGFTTEVLDSSYYCGAWIHRSVVSPNYSLSAQGAQNYASWLNQSSSAAVGFKSEAIRACSSINQAGQGRGRVIKKYTHPRRSIKIILNCWWPTCPIGPRSGSFLFKESTQLELPANK